jgi:hypothetical protein
VHTTKFAMSWHERTHADPAARAFRALVRRVLGEHPVKKSAQVASRHARCHPR